MFTKDEDEKMIGRLETRHVKCHKNDEVCSNFIVAIIPAIKYDTYDIYVHMRKIALLDDQNTELKFKYYVVDQNFTIYFLVL